MVHCDTEKATEGLDAFRTPVVTRTTLFEDYWPCAGGLSAVTAIGTQLRDLMNPGLTRWRLVVLKNVRRGKREESCGEYGLDSAGVWRLSRLTRDGTVEPVFSRDNIFTRERGYIPTFT